MNRGGADLTLAAVQVVQLHGVCVGGRGGAVGNMDQFCIHQLAGIWLPNERFSMCKSYQDMRAVLDVCAGVCVFHYL